MRQVLAGIGGFADSNTELFWKSILLKLLLMKLTVTEDCKFEPYIQSREYYLPNLQVNEDSSIVGNVASLTHVLVGLRGG